MGTPQLNIKDAEATRLARELAELTGESQTEAVRNALRERLDRQKTDRQFSDAQAAAAKRREFEKVLRKIKKIQAEVRRLGLVESMLTDNDLYDENGLPK